jgi:hypothetical protein
MKDANQPVSAGDVEKATKLDRKVVDKAFTDLKKEDKIFSPIRCKWQPK